MANEERIYIEDKYRAVFNSGFGIEVLADILVTCHWGVTLDPENAVQIAEYNAGLVIAGKAGLLNDIDRMLGIFKEEEIGQ